MSTEKREFSLTLSDEEQRIKSILDKHFWMTHTSLATSLIAKEIAK